MIPMTAFKLPENAGSGYTESFMDDDCSRPTTSVLDFEMSFTPLFQDGASYTWTSSSAEEDESTGVVFPTNRMFTIHPSEPMSLPSGVDLITLISECLLTDENAKPELVLSNKDLLLDVKHFLGLTTTELASIMGVSRQAIYAWFHDDSDIRHVNFRRLKLLHGLADKCRIALGRPLPRHLKKADIAGRSFFSVLTAHDIDPAAATSHLSALLARAHSEASKPETLAQRSKALGFKPMPGWMQTDSIGQVSDEE
jgi:transcriptional regulator with XRE-family HTH domain